ACAEGGPPTAAASETAPATAASRKRCTGPPPRLLRAIEGYFPPYGPTNHMAPRRRPAGGPGRGRVVLGQRNDAPRCEVDAIVVGLVHRAGATGQRGVADLPARRRPHGHRRRARRPQ